MAVSYVTADLLCLFILCLVIANIVYFELENHKPDCRHICLFCKYRKECKEDEKNEQLSLFDKE